MTRWLLRLKVCGPTVVDKSRQTGAIRFPRLFLYFPTKSPMSASWMVLSNQKVAVFFFFLPFRKTETLRSESQEAGLLKMES